MKTRNATTSEAPAPINMTFRLERLFSSYRIPLSLISIALLVGIPFFGLGQYIMRILVMIGIYSMLGMGLNLLTGYTGQVSLGHAGFYAIGAYVSAILSLQFGVHFLISCLSGAVVAALCGFLLGLPTLRLTGTYLSIVTLGFGEIVRMVLLNWESVTNGSLGIRNIPRPKFFGVELTLANNGMYYLTLIFLLLITFGCYLIVNSKIGRAFISIKEDELAATMMGVRTTRYKVLAFVLSAFISGIAGAIYASMIRYIDPNSFTFDTSILIISIVIFGGMGTFRGVFLGAALLISFPELLRFMMDYRFVAYGLILVVMMRFRPQGLLGWQSQLPYRLPRNVHLKKGHEPMVKTTTQRVHETATAAGQSKTFFQVNAITKQFGGLVAVDKVSFEVAKGEVVSLIGPNGAGKTTVFNILTGVYQIREGEILFNDRHMQNKAPQDIVSAGISRTFQNIRLFPNMRVIENVLVGTHIRTKYSFADAFFRTKRYRREESDKVQHAINILESIGLSHRLNDYAKNLPYGEQRKLEIARAIATDAQILLLDEPAAGMNPQESEELLMFIRHLRDEGYTIILIEHDMSVVMNISDRIYVIDHGRQIAHGLPADIANNPCVIEVGLVSGGGSGHEPAHAGYVGTGMLDAAVSGNVFSSPSPDRIIKGIEEANAGEGVLLIIKNYSGDVMNFGMAKELAEMDDIRVESVIVKDDVAVPDSTYSTGRRGIAGTVFVHKIAGACAENGGSLDTVKAVAEKTISNIRSMGMAMTSCTLPAVGKPGFQMAEDEIEIGMGIHGEPGVNRTSIKTAEEIAGILLGKILDDMDFIGSEVALMVNGLGATPLMELYILNHEVEKILTLKGIRIYRTFVGNFMTALEMSGCSLTLLKLDNELKTLLDAPCSAPAMKIT